MEAVLKMTETMWEMTVSLWSSWISIRDILSRGPGGRSLSCACYIFVPISASLYWLGGLLIVLINCALGREVPVDPS